MKVITVYLVVVIVMAVVISNDVVQAGVNLSRLCPYPGRYQAVSGEVQVLGKEWAWQQCAHLCRQNLSCKNWTWDKAIGQRWCYAYSSDIEKIPSTGRYISGSRECGCKMPECGGRGMCEGCPRTLDEGLVIKE